MQKVNDNDTEGVTGGSWGGREMTVKSIDDQFVDEQYEEALRCFGAKGGITWGNEINDFIPMPWSKTASMNYNGKTWTPVLAHCGWHQSEVIWKSSDGDYLVPTGISMQGM